MAKKQNGKPAGPSVGEFVLSPAAKGEDLDEVGALPEQEDFWRPPVRFGSVPVEKEPLGWDRRRGFKKLFPPVYLPFQIVDRVSFGHADLEPNRLFWGDNLHIMRQLPSETIDLIYIDPPFFSGRNYNVIFGDQNELRSFSDIWEGGMPGYLIWLNARLYEMKRLLKKTGTIFVHCDWHASHYIKVEMDKVFGYDNLRNEIIWCYRQGGRSNVEFPKKHDTLLWYSRGNNWTFNADAIRVPYEGTGGFQTSGKGVTNKATGRTYLPNPLGKVPEDWWDIPALPPMSSERIGYPTQKPKALLERIIKVATKENDVVADFFVGGGTTISVAEKLKRRWIACDQSRVAVAITADRLTQEIEEESGRLFSSPDFTIEHWGIYEAKQLSRMKPDQFRGFVLSCFGARTEDLESGIHGMKGAVPVWVGDANPKSAVTAQDVQDYANSIRKSIRYKQDNLRDGIMLAWAYRKDAVEAAERLRRLEQTDLNFIRLEEVRIDSPRFREHVAALSTDNADYENFLTFVQPPRVEVGFRRISTRTFRFDVSETIVLNSGAKIINVQWDFNYKDRFSSTAGYSFIRGKNSEPELQVEYSFPKAGKVRVACKVQDDMGGEGLWSEEIDVK
ncbi:MAG: site-specific DNA-methyltransferase [Xanthobacteraceae bacterium]|nr:site-specific DNA-methyltransferase [Xanthobacteraceae bacterium]